MFFNIDNSSVPGNIPLPSKGPFRVAAATCVWRSGLHSVWPDVRLKSSPMYPKSYQKLATSVFFLQTDVFKVAKYFGYFYEKKCNQQLIKIAQSGIAVEIENFLSLLRIAIVCCKCEWTLCRLVKCLWLWVSKFNVRWKGQKHTIRVEIIALINFLLPSVTL